MALTIDETLGVEVTKPISAVQYFHFAQNDGDSCHDRQVVILITVRYEHEPKDLTNIYPN